MYGFSINKKPSMHDGSNTINIQHNLKQEEEEEEVSHADIYAKESDFTPGPSNSGADQLALTFQGEVYVSNSVSPDKVQGVLLLLGEYKILSDIPALRTVPVTQRDTDDIRGKLIQPQRAASLYRFRGKKRKERSFDKKIGYNVRKELALRMRRKNSQFTSPRQDEQASLCTHCGISCKSTPQMRHGPAGPKTLCNACGLNWVKKGVLRDLSKVSSVPTQDRTAKTTEQSNSEANDSEAVTVTADVVSSLKPPKDDWMLCKNGQFKAAKAVSKEVAASTSSGWKGTSNPGQDEQASLCTHCGISCKSTPQMRRGPAGPKTLCNACGLNWVKKGVLRDLSKVSSLPTQDQTAMTIEQSDSEANDSEAVTVIADFLSSLKPPKDEWLRKNGQFISAKGVCKEVAASTSEGWKGMSNCGQNYQTRLCKHCGISCKSTPQMRLGPAGPKTLCNACGLYWVKKGVLRDLSKVSSVPTQDQTAKTTEQSDFEANDSEAVTMTADVISSLKPLKDEWMLCKNDQFTSAKAVSKEVAASTSVGWKGMSNPGQHEQSSLCKHCGISRKSTPQMRRGPAGPKTLCNACGLTWVKKGVLRDLSKVSSVPTQDQTAMTTEQSNSEANDSKAVTVIADVLSSLKPLKDEWMLRKNGQFTSAKAVSKEGAASTSAGRKGMSNPGQHEQSRLCMHCGISCKSTPQMRRGPAGPKTLCNACGLNLVKKGVLRDLSKVSSVPIQDQTAKTTEQLSDSEANDSEAVTVTADVVLSLKPPKDEWQVP